MALIAEQLYDYDAVVAAAHKLGATHITRNSVVTAAYRGSKPLKKTMLNGRVYLARSDVEAWLSGERQDS